MAKILVIEDEGDLAKVLKKRLTSSGFEVIISLDAYQGIEAAHKEKPDLIILDLMMPAGGGQTVLKNLKISKDTMSIPVVVITGTKNEELKNEILAQGVEAYLEKPYDSEELIKIIKKILVI